jgi:hypothetical protein
MTIFSKIILLLFSSLLLSSCCTQKKIAKKDSLMCQGIVHLSENGCPYFIEITQSQVDGIAIGSKIYPVQIKDSFKKKGLKLAFDAVISRAPSPSDCNADGVASLSNIIVVP